MSKTYWKICAIIMGFLFASSYSSDTLSRAEIIKGNATTEISTEIKIIIERNQATLDYIRSIQAEINTIKNFSFETKGRRQIVETSKIWDDGSHVRKDLLESRFIGEEKQPLLFSEDSRGNRVEFGAASIGEMQINSVESTLNYYPDSQKVFIRQPEWNYNNRIKMNDILRYQSVIGATLKENVLLSARNGYYFGTKSEKVDGEDCILLSCYYPGQKVMLKIWVVPSKGYCIKKVQQISKGKVYEQYTTTLKEYSKGFWWFETAMAESWRQVSEDFESGNSKKINTHASLQLTVNSLSVNEPIDTKTFTIVGTNIPYGTKIIDEITKISYVYGAGFQLPQEDVDLALDALEESMGREIKSSVNKTEPNEIKLTVQRKVGSRENVVKIDKNPEGLALTKGGNSKDSQSWHYGLLLGFGIVLTIIISGFILVRGKKLCKK